VFKTALLVASAGLICVHNHPTGDPNPSSEDIAITRRLKEAGEIIGINLLDHIVIGSPDIFSFAERSLL
jgi:DNA repair protein RadC